jgi:hypothetical protein
MKNKSETRQLLKHFCAYVSTQFSVTVKCIRSDNGAEFSMHSFYAEHGIKHETSCVQTPQQNGIVERKHQHILNVARSLIFQSSLPLSYWGYVVLHAVRLINTLPTPALSHVSPFQILYNKVPDYNFFKVFGCLVYASTLQQHRDKFGLRGHPCVYLGCSETTKGFLLLNLHNRQVFISRDCIFHEQYFPFRHSTFSASTSCLPQFSSNSDISPTVFDDCLPSPPSTSNLPSSSPLPSSTISIPSPNLPAATHLRRSTRQHHPPPHLSEFVCPTLPSHSSPHSSNFLHSYTHLAPVHTSYLLNLNAYVEPQSFQEALLDTAWCDAMKAELHALVDTHTWDIVTLPADKIPIGCKWVYKVKLHADGTLERFKARLVAKGYTQQGGVDYVETFSPVAKMVTIRTLLSVAVSLGWFLQ